jgi:hypothetical protein
MVILTLCSRYPRTSLTVALVPWKETDSMQERVKFVLEWEKRWNAGHGLRLGTPRSYVPRPPRSLFC